MARCRKSILSLLRSQKHPLRTENVNKSLFLDIEYYPQNDWRNFLTWPDQIQDLTPRPPIVESLVDYINQVKNYYGL